MPKHLLGATRHRSVRFAITDEVEGLAVLLHYNGCVTMLLLSPIPNMRSWYDGRLNNCIRIIQQVVVVLRNPSWRSKVGTPLLLDHIQLVKQYICFAACGRLRAQNKPKMFPSWLSLLFMASNISNAGYNQSLLLSSVATRSRSLSPP